MTFLVSQWGGFDEKLYLETVTKCAEMTKREVAKYLGAAILNATNEDGNYLLHAAALHDNAAFLAQLIQVLLTNCIFVPYPLIST